MIIQDERYKGTQIEAEQMSYSYEEQESTFTYNYNDEVITVYSSISKDITKLLKVCDHEKVEVITVNINGRITAIKCYITRKQLSIGKGRRELTENEKKRKAEQMKLKLNN